MKCLSELNYKELKNNYYIGSLPDDLVIKAAEIAAEKGLYLYVYTTAVNKGPALETTIRIVYTKESQKKTKNFIRVANAEDGSYRTVLAYSTGGYVELGRARLCKTPRGSLYRFVEDLINTLESY